MKKTITIILITVMLMAGITVNADSGIGGKILDMVGNQLEILRLQAKNVQAFVAALEDIIPLMLDKLKDVKATDWYKDNLALLFGMEIVQGDDQGNFNPNKEVTGSEYLKMVVVAKDNKTYTASAGEQWDKPYIDRALALGLVKSGEISDYRKPLNRYNMARIIVRACEETYGDYNRYQNSLTDYGKMPAEYKEFVLKAYSKGIITGYPDGTFGGGKTMKRSEATAVIARLIDPSQRIAPQLPKIDNDLINVPITSEATIRIYPENDPDKVDFTFIIELYKPIEPQYVDVENLLAARFGKDNPKVREIMAYVKTKDSRGKDLPDKKWIINGYTVLVGSNPNAWTFPIMVWRYVR